MPKISIIVPVYKVESYIHRCVDSILSQTFTDFELILVDDGSPDACPQICDEYAIKDPRVHVIHKPNGGSSDARNAGLAYASGEYIGFVDSDDYIEENMYETLLSYANLGEIMYGEGHWISEKGEVFPEDVESVKEDCVLSEDNWTPRLVYEVPCAVWKGLYSRDLIKKNQLTFNTDVTYGEDRIFCLKAMGYAEKTVYVKRALYNYCERDGSICHSFNDNYFENIIIALENNVRTISDAWKNSDEIIQYFYQNFVDRIISVISYYKKSNSRYGFKKRVLKYKSICNNELLRNVITEYDSNDAIYRLVRQKRVFLLALYGNKVFDYYRRIANAFYKNGFTGGIKYFIKKIIR